jgi:hypothetical protein
MDDHQDSHGWVSGLSLPIWLGMTQQHVALVAVALLQALV